MDIDRERIVATRKELIEQAEAAGFHINPDLEFTDDLVEGLLTNEERYGYRSCPCRLASGDHDGDRDIICPCTYREPDVDEFGACFCALYVSQEVIDGTKEIESIPERRPPEDERSQTQSSDHPTSFKTPVWRCVVCGYLCGRDEPPHKCPICKAGADRFERFA